MISLQLQRCLSGGKRLVIVPNCFYSSGPKHRNGLSDDVQGSVHLPNNVEELDAGQKAQFSQERARDISGPNIDSHFQGAKLNFGQGKHQAGEDAHVGAYACSGSGIHLNSVMQPNVPLPFHSASSGGHEKASEAGDHSSYVDNPPEGGHWTGGEKYLAEDRKNVHARGGRQGGGEGIGSKPGTTPLAGHNKSLAFLIGSLPVTCCGLPSINHSPVGCNGIVLVSHQALGSRLFLPMKSMSCLAFSTSVNNSNINVAPLSRKDKLKKAVKDYGATVIVFHVGISLLSLGGFYLAVSSGLNVVDMLGKLGLSGGSVAKEAGTFAVAYVVHKAFAPVRISITLAATPFIVRYLRRVGFLKPPK
ncbi:uncharacterized protein [Hetaerina americana]|uniref:uncharacterized protein n=1 Tax=Hetaerina americana TaxID=62018 RepID=UPI003A7F4EA6